MSSPPLHIVLFEPEIPPNTGNLIRLSANTGCALHLVEPLGFNMDEKSLRRAGLDYSMWASVHIHPNLDSVREELHANWYAFTTKGKTRHDQVKFQHGDVLLFGPETRGLPDDVLAGFVERTKVKLPMVAGGRSLNLANAVSIAVYEGWRQLGFVGADLS
ncbi:MAG: tRNA (cytidine(34)-2'-O)-methyltransferase [Gammaproteobacteria bacterium]|nr:tRNA (cytidine(34)-2'-O)-methyltransferase [Gammaproteobacteria bacterium]